MCVKLGSLIPREEHVEGWLLNNINCIKLPQYVALCSLSLTRRWTFGFRKSAEFLGLLRYFEVLQEDLEPCIWDVTRFYFKLLQLNVIKGS